MRSFFGNFGVLVRAYAYILSLGGDGLEEASRMALFNANYIRKKLEKTYQLAYNEPCMHECIFTDRVQQRYGVSTLDIAKRLLDYGYHPPTIYFPLVVSGALMIEPTETETPETLDRFIEAMLAIAQEAKDDPELVKMRPHTTPVRRLDEARAASKPVLRWEPRLRPTANVCKFQASNHSESARQRRVPVVETVIVVFHRRRDRIAGWV